MICKLLERLIKDHMVDFLVKHKLLNCLNPQGLYIPLFYKWLSRPLRFYTSPCFTSCCLPRVVVDGEVYTSQGSVLGPILFLIYINDLDDSITSNVLKFADDTKLFRKVNTDGDKQHLQNDLDRLVKWSEKWQMLFNFGKCKCLHTGHGNLNVNYKMGDTVLGTTVKEKDLGVTISADMKVSEQCGIAASKGNQILGLLEET